MATEIFRFLDFVVDFRARALYRGNRYVGIRGKPFELLRELIRKGGENVTKEELITKVWKDAHKSTNCVEEAISRLREKLDDTAQPHSIVGTDFGNGYFFIPPVVRASASAIPKMKAHRALETSYVVQPATAPDIRWVAQLAEKVYTGDDVIPVSLMLAWYERNSNGFSVIRSKMNAPSGNLDLLPIQPEPLQRFVKGEITESDLHPDYLFGASDSERITDLYVESMVTVAKADAVRPKSNPMAAAQALSEFEIIVRRICNPDNLQHVYAIAATTHGRKLLKHLGFDLCTGKQQRKDGHDLFVAEYPELARRLRSFFGAGRRDETAMRLLDDTNTEERGL